MWKKILCLVFIAALAPTTGTAMGDAITGLEGYWPLDNDAQDFSGNDRHGTIIGDPQFIVDGVFGGALEFDGDDYIIMEGYKGILSPPWTLAAWINTTTGGSLDIVSWGTEGGGLKVEFRLDEGRLRIEHGNGNNQGINLRNVDKIAIGLGTTSGITGAGGSGTIYIDDIRLYQ